VGHRVFRAPNAFWTLCTPAVLGALMYAWGWVRFADEAAFRAAKPGSRCRPDGSGVEEGRMNMQVLCNTTSRVNWMMRRLRTMMVRRDAMRASRHVRAVIGLLTLLAVMTPAIAQDQTPAPIDQSRDPVMVSYTATGHRAAVSLVSREPMEAHDEPVATLVMAVDVHPRRPVPCFASRRCEPMIASSCSNATATKHR